MNNRKIKVAVIVTAFCIAWSNALQSAAEQRLVIGQYHLPQTEQGYPPLVGLDLIEAQEYDNSIWNKLWNTYLRVISRKALEAGLPYNAYNVETLKKNFCTHNNPYISQRLGPAIGFIEKHTEMADQKPLYKGVNLKFSAGPNVTPAIEDVCAWLAPDGSTKPDDIISLYKQIIVANPPSRGTWTATDPSTPPLPADARPAFKGRLPGSDADNEMISWELLGDTETLIRPIRESVRKSWSYTVDGEPSGLYFTTASVDQAMGDWPVTSLIATFNWAQPSALNLKDDEIPVLWTRSDPETVSKDLFLMTTIGLPMVPADVHLDKALSTSGYLAIPQSTAADNFIP